MRKTIVIVVILAALGGGAWYYRSGNGDTAAASPNQPGGGGPGRGSRAPMPVDMAPATRHEVIDYITVVGNLIGQATVDVVPRVGGRIESIPVKMGDRVTRGQTIAKIEDDQIREQINQRLASLKVNEANVAQRESDAKLTETIYARMKAQYDRDLLSKQLLEDAEAKYNTAVSNVGVAKAQLVQMQSSVDELKITLANTTVTSPVDGFVSRRVLDQGAFAGANTVILSVVDISVVRMVANVVEKDMKRVHSGVQALVEVDAFPGEQFAGVVSRVAPVFDPATRTAPMEIEVPNPGYRLKPGLYARVKLTVDRRPNALTVPRGAIADIEGKRGVFMLENQVARFHEVKTGLQDNERVEILDGLNEGQRVVTVGTLALRDGDRISVVGEPNGDGQGRRGRRGGGGANQPPTGRE
ncbi:MAG TPA: efflux RND transporter periplasmic adaptor subunit [Vicinamibacterales bacterium]|nr:efflux RND transporter periplasmic adaptor subunit [Vicinamibacterales bacterium]